MNFSNVKIFFWFFSDFGHWKKRESKRSKKKINQYFVLIRILQKTQMIASSDSLIKRNDLNKRKKRPKKEY